MKRTAAIRLCWAGALACALALAVLLSGCAQPAPVIIRDRAYVTVELVDTITHANPAVTVYGSTACSTVGICTIKIRRETYPACLGHELRHVFEGNWHEGYETAWGCEE